jgi:hypothetical protein
MLLHKAQNLKKNEQDANNKYSAMQNDQTLSVQKAEFYKEVEKGLPLYLN